MEKQASKPEWKPKGRPDWNRDIISDPDKARQKERKNSYEEPIHHLKMERAQSLQRTQGSHVIHSMGKESNH
eukprot:11301940-Ditylum_brightwellii.AAC.1